jgi:hypothetical protein
METPELNRLQSDLTTMREAAGLELPFGWEDVWLTFAVGVMGAIAFAWAMLVRQWPNYWGFVPMLVIGIPCAVWLRVRYRRGTARSPVRRREYSASLVLMIVAVSLAIVYRLWASHLGLPFRVIQAMFFVGCGCALVVPVILDRRRVAILPFSVCLMVAGLVMPWVKVPAPAIVGLAIAIAGPASALVAMHQLRRAGREHAAD